MNYTWRMMTGEVLPSRYTEGGSMYGKILRPWTEVKLKRLFLLRAAGLSQAKCSRVLGMAVSTVRFACSHYLHLMKVKTVKGKKTVSMRRTLDGGRHIRCECH